MKEKCNHKYLFAAVVAVLLIIAAFFAGSKYGSTTTSTKYQADEDKRIYWNRCELQYLLGTDETIYVTGHKAPDTDAVCSAILYARLLQELGYDARPYGSTATINGMRYLNYGVEIDSQAATLMAGAILSDTKNLQSDNTTPADRGALEDLSSRAGIDCSSFYQDMYKALISYEGMTDEEIFFSDYKEYESGL